MPTAHVLGLFQRLIDGDDALLRLAQRRFDEVGMGAEFYPENVQHLEWEWEFRPPSAPGHVAHLPRNWDLRAAEGREGVLQFARAFAGRLLGTTVHDQRGWGRDRRAVVDGLRRLDAELAGIVGAPEVFIEYAAGEPLESYTRILAEVADCPHISACVDIGHVGIFNARRVYDATHPGEALMRLRPDSPELPELIADVQDVVTLALPTVLEVIDSVTAWGKPVHLHLHDGHPLSQLSEYGVRDHLSFGQSITLPFAYDGETSVPPLYGREGLAQILATALSSASGDMLSFEVEIHPQPGQEPLGRHEDLFPHWKDRTNAERMNAWITRLQDNCRLVQELLLAPVAAAAPSLGAQLA
jgi:hypothetical protein